MKKKEQKIDIKSVKTRFMAYIIGMTAFLAGFLVFNWFVAFPNSLSEGSESYLTVANYIVEHEDALRGANPAEVHFTKSRMYSATYHGQEFIITDASTQNQIAAFEDFYSGCNYFVSCVAVYSLYSFMVIAASAFSIYAKHYSMKQKIEKAEADSKSHDFDTIDFEVEDYIGLR